MTSGWFRESHRHYLASKGVSTNRYMRSKWKGVMQLPTGSQIEDARKGLEAGRISNAEFDIMRERPGVLSTRQKLNAEIGFRELFPQVTPGTTEDMYAFIEEEKRKENLFRIQRLHEMQSRYASMSASFGKAKQRFMKLMEQGEMPREVAMYEIQKMDTALKDFREALEREKSTLFYAKKERIMRSTDVRDIPEGEGWSMERKWDGSRIVVTKDEDELRLTNRRGVEKLANFPELKHLLSDIRPDAAVIDGELVVRKGKDESFKELSSREHSKAGEKIHAGMTEHPAKIMAFDMLLLGKNDLRQWPLTERRQALRNAVREDKHIEVVKPMKPTKENIAKLKREGAEGVIFKRDESAYVGGKSKEWQKLKFKKTRDVIASGYEEGTGKRKGLIGAMRIADAGGRSLGKVGTGFSDAENARLKKMLDAGKKPVVRVEYLKAGTKGALREPVYVGLRSDIKRSEAN